MEELRDLYDKNKNLTGEKYYKGEIIPKDRYILVVTLFILNQHNELLLQKRSKEKGGKFGFLSGHPKAGENSFQGIITELKEELGIYSKEMKLFHTEKTKNAFFDFYYLKSDIDISKLELQKEEVESVKWFSICGIEKLIDRNEFYENHIEALDIIKNILNNKVGGFYGYHCTMESK